MIELKDGWVIDADSYGYSLQKTRLYTNKEGKEIRMAVEPTFHRTIQDAANAYLARAQRKAVSEARDGMAIEEAVRQLNTIHEEVQTLFKEHI